MPISEAATFWHHNFDTAHSMQPFGHCSARAMHAFCRRWWQILVLVLLCLGVLWSTRATYQRTDGKKRLKSPTAIADARIPKQVEAETPSVSTLASQTRLSFLLWMVNLAPTADNLFALDLAAELAALGHVVVVESAAGGELTAGGAYHQHRGQRKFRVEVNPALGEVLFSGYRVPNIWNVISASFDGVAPNIVIFFSAAWKNLVLHLPDDGLRPSRSRLVWYFYFPHDCKEKRDVSEAREISPALSRFDMVLFPTDSSRAEWAKAKDGKFLTFRPFLRTAEASSIRFWQVAKDRDDLRLAHSISLDAFIVTVADHPSCANEEVDPASSNLVQMMQDRFGTDWLIVLYDTEQQSAATQSSNIILISEWPEFLRYIAAADLHVSLSRSEFGFEAIHARSFAVPVLMLPSELAASSDCFILKKLKQQSLEVRLKGIIRKPTRALFEIGEAGRQAILPGHTGSGVATRVSHLVDRLSHLLVSPRGSSKKRIGIFMQMFNPHEEFPLLWPCIQNVLEMQGVYGVDVIITTTQPLSTLQTAVAKLRSRTEVFYVVASQAEDRGGDVGVFLQQLLLSRELSIASDIIFKVNLAMEADGREESIEPMCGSASTVRRVLSSFSLDTDSGMMGPARFTWNLQGQEVPKALDYFGRGQEARHQMMSSWSAISSSDFPEEKYLWIVTSGSYWLRMNLPWWDGLLPQVTRLLGGMGPHDTACLSAACQAGPALHWIIPSLISSNGNTVAARKAPRKAGVTGRLLRETPSPFVLNETNLAGTK